jgi:activator of HSP90 ATPase
MTGKLRMTAAIPAEPAAVYGAWLSSKGHSDMTGGGARVSAKVGGKFSAWDGYISGKNLGLKPGKLIRQAWRTTEFPEAAPDSLLEIRLEKKGRGTKLTLTQTGIPDGQSGEYRKGWTDYYFGPMKEYFGGK